jgi:hypothetical protein|tara:strand:+ start:533 stop:775 length:243 start_codon:yes stop_codon:yes gene_type:complete
MRTLYIQKNENTSKEPLDQIIDNKAVSKRPYPKVIKEISHNGLPKGITVQHLKIAITDSKITNRRKVYYCLLSQINYYPR